MLAFVSGLKLIFELIVLHLYGERWYVEGLWGAKEFVWKIPKDDGDDKLRKELWEILDDEDIKLDLVVYDDSIGWGWADDLRIFHLIAVNLNEMQHKADHEGIQH